MDRLAGVGGVSSDIAVIGCEVLLAILVFAFLGIAIRLVFNRLESPPTPEQLRDRIPKIRRGVRAFVLLALFLSIIGIIGVNASLMYRGTDVYAFTRGRIAEIPAGFWTWLALTLAKILAVVIAAPFVTRTIRRSLLGLQEWAKAYEQITANDESIEVFFKALDRIQRSAIWFLVVMFALWALNVPGALLGHVATAFKVYLIIAAGFLFADAVSALVDSLDALSEKYGNSESLLTYYAKLSELIPLLRRCLEYGIYVMTATLALMQLTFIAQLADYGPRIVQGIGIFFLARVAVALVDLLVDRTLLGADGVADAARQRQLTIIPIVKSLASYLVYFGAFVLILRAFAFDPVPILAGAGIVGVVVGLGAQPLINDIVSGFFILFENLYLVGDFIETAGARGRVEAVEMRTTRIRDPDGQLHILRNGQLGQIVNYSKDYTFAVVEVGVAYDSNLEQVYRVLEAVGVELAAANEDILEPTEVKGLEDFGASELTIRTVTKVKPGRHNQVERDFRKMIKDAFDREGIEIPFGQRVVTFKNPARIQMLDGDREP